MNILEVRKHKEYDLCMNKIKSYSKGFKFTIPFNRMTIGQANAMRIILNDAVDAGLIKSVAVSFGLDLNIGEEMFEKVVAPI